MAVKIQSIDTLMISDREPSSNDLKSHAAAVDRLKTLAERNALRFAALGSLKVTVGTPKDHIAAIQKLIDIAITQGNVFDYGVINNEVIAAWEIKAEKKPVEVLAWNGPAIFLMTHPQEVPYDAMSVYLLMANGSKLVVSELMFLDKSETLLVYQTLHANIPVGINRAVTVTAYSDPEPSPLTVNSTLNPAIMGVAFLSSSENQRPS